MENNDLLIRLVRNAVSKFEVICEINKRNIEISKNEDFILLKLSLQIDLAKELLSNSTDTEDEEHKRRYEDILKNSEGQLKEIESKKRDTSYHCQVSGCTFRHNWYRMIDAISLFLFQVVLFTGGAADPVQHGLHDDPLPRHHHPGRQVRLILHFIGHIIGH